MNSTLPSDKLHSRLHRKFEPANAIPSGFAALLLLLCVGIELRAAEQPSTPPPQTSLAGANKNSSVQEQIAAAEIELTNAWNGVLKIVNQPVRAFAHVPNISVSVYSPGWFHEGAIRPDFNTVDVRQTQELPYAKSQYVTSDLNPGMVFLGQELEFNSMTKLFYTNRSLPKHKLSEAEMVEINRLYRIIGKCEKELRHLHPPSAEEVMLDSGAQDGTEEVIPGQAFSGLRSIPRRTRIIYGSIAIGALVLVVIGVRFSKKNA